MKKILYAGLLSLSLLMSGCGGSEEKTQQMSKELEGAISLSGAFGLYPLAQRWAAEFRRIHPKVMIDVSAGGAGKGVADMLSGNVDIGMVSRDLNAQEISKGAYVIAVAKDAVVPTFNQANPHAAKILSQGLTQKKFKEIWISGKVKTWGQILGSSSGNYLQVFTRSDAAGASETWAAYLGGKQEDLKGVAVFGDPGLAEAVRNDQYGVGYNNIAYVYDPKTRKPHPGIKVLPLDLNGNGKIDPQENFYDDLESLTGAIAKGVYPSPPARELYFVTKGKPDNKIVLEFVNWVLTDGQKFVGEAGYVQLPDSLLKAQVIKLKQ